MTPFDPTAIASDVPRSRGQALVRMLATVLVRLFRLNGAGYLSTEFIQALAPTATIPTRYGPLYCRAGHGRLLWRARTFHTEEPETITWLDGLGPDDVLWDVGANVGLYAIYATKFRGCRAIAVEPEGQNYALLVENIALNGVAQRCLPASFALSRAFALGRLRVRYVTKGGAYNLFAPLDTADQALPGQFDAVKATTDGGLEQLLVGFSLDDLVERHGLPAPTHLKIDVDGIEPDIIEGASRTIGSGAVRSILIEINRKSERDLAIADVLAAHGFQLVSERSNWLSRTDRTREHEVPTTNMIFARPARA